MPRISFDFLQTDNNEVALTPLLPEYYPAVSELAASDRSHLNAYESFYEQFCSIAVTARQIEQSHRNDTQWFALLGRGVVVGAIYGQYLHFPKPTLGVGYWVHSHYSGRGIATQAVGLLVDHVFSEGIADSALASPRVHNHASRKVLLANGFLPEGKPWVGPTNHTYQRFYKHHQASQ